MTYSLYRTDGRGDSGPLSMALRYNDKDELETEHNARPKIGWALQVGSPYARSYVAQDYWQTTYVTEILEDTPDQVIFKTRNSEYTWRQF